MAATVRRLIYIFIIFFIILLSGGQAILPTYAATSGYSNVLTDLQRDENFNINDYKSKPNDYSINVIQIAESANGELFLYTYQPCQLTQYLVATDINMSLSESADETKLYSLSLLNSSGVFCKYLVNGVTVSSAGVRYYNVTSIYREWNKTIDGESGNDNLKLEKYYDVGKCYKAVTVGGNVTYTCKQVDTVEIKNPFVDYLSYGDSSGWDLIFDVVQWTDIHYIAFSTDKMIDTLKEADVTYTTQPYHYTGKNDEGYTYGGKSEPQYITLTGTEEFGVTGTRYVWSSIYRSEDFIKTTELTGNAKTEVQKSEFVLVFLKTSFTERDEWSLMQGHYKVMDGTKVSNVSILRLKFETDGITYNLGALMDKQEGDDTAGNKPEDIGFWAYIWRCIVRLFNGTATLAEQVVAVVAIFICVFVLMPILLKLVIPLLGWIIKGIFSLL